MRAGDIDLLRANIDRNVKITLTDGEVLTVKVIAVSDEHQDLIYDIVATNRPNKYEKTDVQPAYLTELVHIAEVSVSA